MCLGQAFNLTPLTSTLIMLFARSYAVTTLDKQVLPYEQLSVLSTDWCFQMIDQFYSFEIYIFIDACITLITAKLMEDHQKQFYNPQQCH